MVRKSASAIKCECISRPRGSVYYYGAHHGPAPAYHLSGPCGTSLSGSPSCRTNVSRRPRRIGLMMAIGEADPEGQARVQTFVRSLEEDGLDGRPERNVSTSTGIAAIFSCAQTAAKDYVDDKSTSSSSTARQAWMRCVDCKRAYPSCSSWSAIRSERAMCQICRGPARTSLDSAPSSRKSQENGCSC